MITARQILSDDTAVEIVDNKYICFVDLYDTSRSNNTSLIELNEEESKNLELFFINRPIPQTETVKALCSRIRLAEKTLLELESKGSMSSEGILLIRDELQAALSTIQTWECEFRKE